MLHLHSCERVDPTARVASEWHETAPEFDPTQTVYFDVRHVWTYRWLPYKKDGRRQMHAQGRWQRATEYGWENCPQPTGDWKLNKTRDAAEYAERIAIEGIRT